MKKILLTLSLMTYCCAIAQVKPDTMWVQFDDRFVENEIIDLTVNFGKNLHKAFHIKILLSFCLRDRWQHHLTPSAFICNESLQDSESKDPHNDNIGQENFCQDFLTRY